MDARINWKALYGPHALLKVAYFIIIVVTSYCVVYKCKTGELCSFQTLIEDSSFALVEGVVIDGEGERDTGGACSKEAADGSIELDVDFVFGVDNLFPPATAHEEKGDNEPGTEHEGQEHATYVSGTHLATGYI